MKLAAERSSRVDSNTYVHRAEQHLQNMEAYAEQGDQGRPGPQRTPTLIGLEGCLDQGETAFEPFLCSEPFTISQESVEQSEDVVFARSASAAIIFNLALVDHLHNRASRQAISLYELATTLIVGDEVDHLGVSLINNIGVWCHDGGDFAAAQRCMDHLHKILPNCRGFLSDAEVDGISSNIRSILNPPCSISPAA